MKQVLFISLLLFYGKLFGQTPNTKTFAKGHSLGTYYPLDSIQKIKLHNLKGDHILSSAKTKSLIPLLQRYVFDGNYAKTKPGHIWGTIFFLNGNSLSFYSNSNNEIIINNNGHKTFISNGKLNFDNY